VEWHRTENFLTFAYGSFPWVTVSSWNQTNKLPCPMYLHRPLPVPTTPAKICKSHDENSRWEKLLRLFNRTGNCECHEQLHYISKTSFFGLLLVKVSAACASTSVREGAKICSQTTLGFDAAWKQRFTQASFAISFGVVKLNEKLWQILENL
jgi:hypothetical protein